MPANGVHFGDLARAVPAGVGSSRLAFEERRAMADLISRFYDEVMNTGDLDRIPELCAEDVVDHEAPPEMPQGIEGVRLFIQMFRQAFPDIHVTVEDVL